MIEKVNDNIEQKNLSNIEEYNTIEKENENYNEIRTFRPLKDTKDINIDNNINDNSQIIKKKENIKDEDLNYLEFQNKCINELVDSYRKINSKRNSNTSCRELIDSFFKNETEIIDENYIIIAKVCTNKEIENSIMYKKYIKKDQSLLLYFQQYFSFTAKILRCIIKELDDDEDEDSLNGNNDNNVFNYNFYNNNLYNNNFYNTVFQGAIRRFQEKFFFIFNRN